LIQETYTAASVKEMEKSFGFKPIIESYQAVIRDLPFVLFTLGGIAILSIEFQRNNFISIRLAKEIHTHVISLWGNVNITLNGVKLLSLLTVENTLIIVLFTAFITKWLKSKSEKTIMYLGFLLFGLGYSVLAFSTNLVFLFAAVIVLSIGELLYVPTRQSLLAEIVDDSRRGAYMAFNGFVFQIGKMVGVLGIMAGEAVNGIGMGILYVVFALLGIVFSRIAIVKRDRKKQVESPSILEA
jgi:DHA1 family multidrug resistance protein B-like MFS transporter